MTNILAELIREFDRSQEDGAKRGVLKETVRCVIGPYVPDSDRDHDDRVIKAADLLIHAIVDSAPPEDLMACVVEFFACDNADEIHPLEIVAHLAFVAGKHATDWNRERFIDMAKIFIRAVAAMDKEVYRRSPWLKEWAAEDKSSREFNIGNLDRIEFPPRTYVPPLVIDLCVIIDSLESGEKKLIKIMLDEPDETEAFRKASHQLRISVRYVRAIWRKEVQPKIRRMMELAGLFPYEDQQEDTSQ